MRDVPAVPIREELRTLEKGITWLVEKYGDQYPGLHENYSVIGGLYLREFEGIRISDRWLRRAHRRRTVNLTSLHRAITRAKKLFQDDGDRVRSDNLQWDWRKAMRVDAKGFDAE